MSERSFPILTVADLGAVRRFYERLGFRTTYQFPPDGEAGYVTMQRGEATLGIGLAYGRHVDAYAYWVYVDDVDRAVEELRAAGSDIVEEPKEEPWGERVARVRDPAGTLVHLASEAVGA